MTFQADILFGISGVPNISLTISQISGFLTRHNCNPFDYQWSYCIDPLDGYVQLSFLFTLFIIDTEMGPKYASLHIQSFNLPSAIIGR